MEVKSGISRLAQMQAVFQQRQSAAREQRLLQETQEQGLMSRTMITERRSAGSLTNISNGAPLAGTISTGKVRQMFDERRKGATGIDKSFPLQPLKTRPAPPPARNEYSYKPVSKSTSTTRRGQVATTNAINGRNATKVLRQPINSYVDRNNGYNSKNNGYYDEQSNETERSQSPTFRADFDLSALLNANQIGEPSLDEEAFPDTSLDFEDMDLNNRSNIKHNTSSGTSNQVKPTPRPPASKSNAVNGADPNSVSRNKLSERSKITVKPTSQPNVVKKTVNQKSPVKESPVRTPVNQSPSKSSPNTAKVPTTPPRPSPGRGGPAHSGPSATSGDLVNCPICGRNFATDRIDKHREICQKTSQKKRKVYDALKHRVQGTDAEQYVRVRSRKNQSGNMQMPKRQPLQTNWRKKHEDFINAIRAAKQVQEHIKAGGKLSDLPPPPPSENPDYVQCPHCGRRFNQAAAERHIPKCATMEHNKPKRNVNKPGASSRNTQRK